jgi:DNA-directed RNA polymerase subunit RPC12/RpoP
VISLDATPEATILSPQGTDLERTTPAGAAFPDYTPTRDCPECRLKGGMVRQNSGLFTVYYICSKCGTQFTIPPPTPPRGI